MNANPCQLILKQNRKS